MKRSWIVSVVLIFAFVIIYLSIDSKLFYYGESKYNIFNHSLPLGLKPNYWNSRASFPEKGFTIESEYGFVIIGKGISFLSDSDIIQINRILKYGFDEECLVALVEYINDRSYYIKCLKNSNPNSKRELQVNILNDNVGINVDRFKWIEYDNNSLEIQKLNSARAISVLLFIIFFSVFNIGSIIIRKAFKIRQNGINSEQK